MSIALARNTTTETGHVSLAMMARLSMLLLTAVAISANFTNYSPLIPLLQRELHISNGQVGLFSTFLYAGIACSYLPGGILADRFGSRRVLMGSLLLPKVGPTQLPVMMLVALLNTGAVAYYAPHRTLFFYASAMRNRVRCGA